MKKIIVLLSTVLCSFFAHATTYYSLGTDKEVLGAGFETDLSMPLAPCLNGDWIYQGGSEGGMAYRGDFDSKTMIDTLTGSIKGSVQLVIFGGSVKFSVRNKTTKNSNSSASTIELNYKKGSYNFENRTLKPEIANLLQTNPSAARQKCGDGFIHNMKLGSNLYVTAKIHFKSRSEYQWYQTQVKVKVLFWSKTFTKTKEFYEATKNAVYSIEVNTDGGLTPRLAELTKNGPIYCKTAEMDHCLDHAEQLFSYLLQGGDYANDITDSQLNNITFDVASYEKSGHYGLAFAGNPNNSKRYFELSHRLRGYQDLVNDEIERLRAFLAVATDESEIAQLTSQLEERSQQKTALDNSADYCYDLPGTTLCEQHMETSIALVN